MLRELSMKAKRRLSSPRLFPQDGNSAKNQDDAGEIDVAPPPSPPPSRITAPLSALRNTPSKPPTPRASFSTSGKHSEGLGHRRDSVHNASRRENFKKAPASPQEPPKKAPGIASPLLSTAELLSWRPTGGLARCVSRVPLPSSAVARYTRPSSSFISKGSLDESAAGNSATCNSGANLSVKRIQPPRVLLCHDFAHGYPLWEAHADGVVGDDCPEDSQMWRFNHWAYVDVFVYFSHYRVSIPPVGYIHAAHRHGALALGTLLFEECNHGPSDLKALLASYRVRTKAATQLATIAKFFGFDGWLLNVECALNSSQMAGDLAAFVAELTRTTRRLVGVASEVIWYDSITRTGELKWQNELNAENEQFFKAAGALFTNYHWDKNAPIRSAVKAGSRRSDVFTGVDVHGRNTYGGGGFQTHLALRIIKQSGTSAAIFAPAWTVERCPPNVPDPLELEERFWTGPRGKFGRESVAQYVKERSVVNDIPFATNFDPGWGPCTIRNGLVVDERRYFNLSRQDVQPSFLRTYVVSGDPSGVSLRMKSGFALHGSASVNVKYAFSDSRMMSGTYAILRLFVANVSLSMPRKGIAGSLASFSSDAEAQPGLSSSSGAEKANPLSNYSERISASSRSLRCAYDYHVNNDDAGAADTFGLVLYLSSSSLAIFLVGKNSSWAAGVGNESSKARLPPLPALANLSRGLARGEKGLTSVGKADSEVNNNGGSASQDPNGSSQGISADNSKSKCARLAMRLQIHDKFVNCQVLTPTREEVIPGSLAGGPGKWFSRVYSIPQELVRGQKLSEILIVVGKTPPQPLSVSPSPAFSPGGSRLASRLGSRLQSRDASRAGSRPGSRPLSRSGSRVGSRSGSPPRVEEIIGKLNDAASNDSLVTASGVSSDGLRESSSRRLSRLRHERFGGLAGGTATETSVAANVDVQGHSAANLLDGRLSLRSRPQNGVAEGYEMSSLRNRRRESDLSYAGAFAVPGSMDFSEMDMNDTDSWSAQTSRAISRLSSRLGTPSRSRVSSKLHSRFASRQASNAGSLVGSRAGSRAESRLISPSQTPIGAGAGAISLLNAALEATGARSGSHTPRAPTTPGRVVQSSLSDLKSALINAASTMAGVSSSVGVANGSSSTAKVSSVHLGSVRLEYFDHSTGRERRSSTGLDNDFFTVDSPSYGRLPSVSSLNRSPSRTKRSFRL